MRIAATRATDGGLSPSSSGVVFLFCMRQGRYIRRRALLFCTRVSHVRVTARLAVSHALFCLISVLVADVFTAHQQIPLRCM